MIFKLITIVPGLVIGLVVVGWLGLQVSAPPFATVEGSHMLGEVPLPEDLPDVVDRYARTVFGDSVPVVDSAIVIGRATIRRNGLALPARLKIYYDASGGYYHFFEVTWFGYPVMTVNERYLDGHTILDIPGEHVENDWKTDHAANQGFWAEVLAWVPAIVFTDERIRWEGVNDTSARLVIPDADVEEAFTVQFDPESGLMTGLTALRYQGSQSDERSRWTNRILDWGEVNSLLIPVDAEIQWDDEQPWAQFHIEQVVYNTDVSGRFQQFGGDYHD